MANIKVFARLKPCQDINQRLIRREDQAVCIYPPEQVSPNASSSSGCINNLQESKPLRFRFVHVFGMKSSQKNVFDVAAKDIVKQFLEGYNGTIFAFGQTGAGKTYTIQGEGVDSFDGSDHSGLIPKSLSLIFQDMAHNQHETVNIHVSFLEIYKETAYDLLDPLVFRGSKKPKELSKVLVTMGGNECCHLHGLSYHCVTSVEEATRLYQLGVATRKTAETLDNQRSSRSHTVFSIMIFRQKHDKEVFLRSKLDLVDLAGSERESKPGADEQQLGETKFVNLSLNHLESVIIALQKFNVRSLRTCSRKKQPGKCSSRCSSAALQRTRSVDGISRPRLNVRLMSASAVELGNGKNAVLAADYEPVHVPYRNSLLTMLLQDSLGGNCNTALIVALSAEEKNVSETISTCRFAQRVARILNKPIRNEEVDKNMVIRRLQRRLAKLHLELANYKHDSVKLRSDDDSSLQDKHECVEVMRSFLAGRINDPVSHGINTPRKFRTSLRYLRQMVVGSSSQVTSDGDHGLQSSDDRDSGVRTSSEPTSPLTSEVENDTHLVSNFIAQLPSPAPHLADASQHRWSVSTHESGISLSTEKEEPTPDGSLPGPSREMPQLPGPGTSVVPTGLLKTLERRTTEQKDVSLGEGGVQPAGPVRENVSVWELELQKETLLNKSKMFTSRLAEQRARLVVMLRCGDLPEELQNEKIVELHLQKKQREVENKLSFVIKKLADLKYTDRRKQSQTTERQQALTQTFKELELKEISTRQKLLSRREQMRNFIGFSSTTQSHQTASSTSSFQSGTSHSSLSMTSSMTSYWEDGGRESGPQYRSVASSPILSTVSSKSKTTVAKPEASGRRPSDTLPQISNMKPSSESSMNSKRGFPSPERFSVRTKRGILRNLNTSCPIACYMNNSHQTLYHKSTFPRRIENGVCSDLHGAKTAQRTIPKSHKACASSKSKFAKNSSSGCLQLKEKSSVSDKVECDPIKPNTDDKSGTEIDAIEDQGEQSKQENKCKYQFETFHEQTPDEKATSKSGENKPEHNIPVATCLNRENRLRVLRIRQLVNAAEVIQRTWRLYKRNKNSRFPYASNASSQVHVVQIQNGTK